MPCCTKVSLKVRIGFKFWISMSGQHFTVCIDIDTHTLGLLQKELKVFQIMSTDYDKRPFFYFQRDGCRGRIAECFGICFIQ